MEPVHYYPHVSVDCVLFGYDRQGLKVLLLEKNLAENNSYFNGSKLPGRLIYQDEDPDDAALAVLKERTGTDNTFFKQFKTFGSPNRTARPEDVMWLQEAVKLKIGRIVTVGYLALLPIEQLHTKKNEELKDRWCLLNELPTLAFDHSQIIEEALEELQRSIRVHPAIIFRLLPNKFTMAELRRVYEVIENKEFDVRNFQKKIKRIPYIVQLDEYQSKVAHRAARYYRFDKKEYNKLYATK